VKDLGACAACHADPKDATQWTGGRSGIACSTCHASYPHPSTWAVDHATATAPLGEAVCAMCHEPGDGPATMVATCAARCHGGAK